MPFLSEEYEEYDRVTKPKGMTKEQEKIWQAAQDGENRRLHVDYSGRGMFGRTCWSVYCDDPNEVICEAGVKGALTDSMGKGAVVYWPNVTGPLPQD